MFSVPPSLRRRRWKVLALALLLGLSLSPVWVPPELGDDRSDLLPSSWADALGAWVDPGSPQPVYWTPFKEQPDMDALDTTRPAQPAHFPGRGHVAPALNQAVRDRSIQFGGEGLSIGLESGLRLHLHSQGARPDRLLDTGGIVPTPEADRLRRALDEQQLRIGLGGEF